MKQNEISIQRRQQILEATCRCLQNKSFHILTIKEIAQEANISYGLVHFYFDSKGKLLTDTIDYVLAYFADSLLKMIEPYQNRQLTNAEILEFFKNWIHLHFTPEYAAYMKIWYDLSMENRLTKKDNGLVISSTYSKTASEPLGRLLSQNNDYMRAYQLMTTYLEGMCLRIFVYGYDQEKEAERCMEFLHILLSGIQN